MTTKELLIRAKEIIERDGWLNYSIPERDHKYKKCVVEAIHYADDGPFSIYTTAKDIFRSANDISSIVPWNDDKERTVEEVYEAFDKAIAAAGV